MMRTEKWKLIKCIDNGFWNFPSTELYDLQSDPEELHNNDILPAHKGQGFLADFTS